jgi:hypothetical protein
MPNLCYWYGAYNDPNNAYSFIIASKLVPFHRGVIKGYDSLSKAIQRKIDEGKKLPGGHDQLVRGLKEMDEDLERHPADRMARMPNVNVFLEVYELSDSEGEDEKKEIPEEPKPKASKSKKKAKQEEVVAEDKQPKPKASKKRKKKDADKEETESKPKKKRAEAAKGGNKAKKKKSDADTTLAESSQAAEMDWCRWFS